MRLSNLTKTFIDAVLVTLMTTCMVACSGSNGGTETTTDETSNSGEYTNEEIQNIINGMDVQDLTISLIPNGLEKKDTVFNKLNETRVLIAGYKNRLSRIAESLTSTDEGNNDIAGYFDNAVNSHMMRTNFATLNLGSTSLLSDILPLTSSMVNYINSIPATTIDSESRSQFDKKAKIIANEAQNLAKTTDKINNEIETLNDNLNNNSNISETEKFKTAIEDMNNGLHSKVIWNHYVNLYNFYKDFVEFTNTFIRVYEQANSATAN